jgi:hypothetical protein
MLRVDWRASRRRDAHRTLAGDDEVLDVLAENSSCAFRRHARFRTRSPSGWTAVREHASTWECRAPAARIGDNDVFRSADAAARQ